MKFAEEKKILDLKSTLDVILSKKLIRFTLILVYLFLIA
jgi:hypothetical protein